MELLLVASCIITYAAQPFFKKWFTQRSVSGQWSFNAMVSLFAFIFFVLTTPDIHLPLEIFPYAIPFALCFSAANMAWQLAIACGSLAVSSLIISYSLILPTLYGLLILHEPAGIFQYAGILLLVISLFLIRNKQEETGPQKISFKWLMFVLLAFLSNGFCCIIQNVQQQKFKGEHNGNFMILALLLSFLMMIIPAFVFEHKEWRSTFKKAVLPSFFCGICNGITNLLVMLSTATIAASVFFPVISAGQLIVIFLISTLVYKEKFLRRQLVGLACGLAALVLLNQ